MALPALAVEPSPMPCYTAQEFADYANSLDHERSVHYAPSSMRRQFGVTDVMVSACLDCPLSFQRANLLRRTCRPPAHERPITPLERQQAGKEVQP